MARGVQHHSLALAWAMSMMLCLNSANEARRAQEVVWMTSSSLRRRLVRAEEAARVSARDWRQLLPPITPRLVLRALLGVLLFFVGLGLGLWVSLFAKRYEKRFERQLAA